MEVLQLVIGFIIGVALSLGICYLNSMPKAPPIVESEEDKGRFHYYS